ncbi:hypothetical protein, partial [Vibrio splendidus]|uniref:hypothetical protein n=1 Tax=Vibrio splendidus TaxID=29497 RepID=UPI001A7E09E7
YWGSVQTGAFYVWSLGGLGSESCDLNRQLGGSSSHRKRFRAESLFIYHNRGFSRKVEIFDICR